MGRGLLLFSWTFLSLLVSGLASAQSQNRVEFILDVSGSMAAVAGGEKKIDAAKQAIQNAVAGIPDGTTVALRLYGHRVPNQNKAESCKDTELVIPFGPIQKPAFLGAVTQAMPLGQTPIAYSLEEAAKDFGALQDETAMIILVSDGAESCGGDPVAVAKALKAKGFNVQIHTIGFDVDATTRAQLMAISEATGGQYQDAKDTAGLTQSLQELTQKALLIQKQGPTVYGEAIRGGDTYESAVALPINKLLHLDHHQRKGQYDYFYLDLKEGQSLQAFFQTAEFGIEINDANQTKENKMPYHGMEIHNAERQRMEKETIIGGPNVKKELGISVGQGQAGRYYILVGNDYDPQHMNSPFQVNLVERFDAGSSGDAGDTEAQALPIPTGKYTAYLGPNDRTDTYKLTTQAGVSYDIKARGKDGKIQFQMTLIDGDGIQLLQSSSPNEGAVVKAEGVSLPKGGDLFIKLSNTWSSVPDVAYDFEITPAGAALPAATPAAIPSAPVAAPVVTAPAPQTPTTPNFNTASTPNTTTPKTTALQDSHAVCQLVKGLPFFEKAKLIFFWMGIPLFAGWLVGMIWGYIKGRKAGRRKALS